MAMLNPQTDIVNVIKLTEYIFLFNGIIKVKGYTVNPIITDIITH
jgi:hypothetical protein